jgi:hypothetical protein
MQCSTVMPTLQLNSVLKACTLCCPSKQDTGSCYQHALVQKPVQHIGDAGSASACRTVCLKAQQPFFAGNTPETPRQVAQPLRQVSTAVVALARSIRHCHALVQSAASSALRSALHMQARHTSCPVFQSQVPTFAPGSTSWQLAAAHCCKLMQEDPCSEHRNTDGRCSCRLHAKAACMNMSSRACIASVTAALQHLCPGETAQL